MRGILTGRPAPLLPNAKSLTAGIVLLCLSGLACQRVSDAADANTTAAPRRDAARCLAHAGIDACNDAIRRNPSDPQLLVALADAEIRDQRPANALRHYRRAAELAPAMRGLGAKINAAEARMHPKKVVAVARRESKTIPAAAPETPAVAAAAAAAPETPAVVAAVAAPDKRYSNDAPVAESH